MADFKMAAMMPTSIIWCGPIPITSIPSFILLRQPVFKIQWWFWTVPHLAYSTFVRFLSAATFELYMKEKFLSVFYAYTRRDLSFELRCSYICFCAFANLTCEFSTLRMRGCHVWARFCVCPFLFCCFLF